MKMGYRMVIGVGILTISDGVYRGKRLDISGDLISAFVSDIGALKVDHAVVPDEIEVIAAKINYLIKLDNVDLILTTGGTGIGPRDVTPEAVTSVIDYEIPGISETFRSSGRLNTKYAILSRSIVGVSSKTLIVTLPGSPNGVEDSLSVLKPILFHTLDLIQGKTDH
tara:strand:- start:3112 stop:3612 length:501 start_codon:yes stop_codon:yes gene_type:complete